MTPSAFNSTSLPDLPPASTEHQNRLYSALNIPLFWGDCTNLDSATELELDFKIEQELAKDDQDSSRSMNAERWNFQYDNKWAHFYLFFSYCRLVLSRFLFFQHLIALQQEVFF
ncbi:hypothetical protein Q9290_03140 [Oceanimonas sp. CHS3-5]|uniref:hypothetical protein n=1 Tax=Oceanimonas sp. CHS3-5 TaxID=3068186 RepID=UPI00273CFB92|nr:hypothetical protein [Oceanimonas sp. CHS3-5]MDP5291289.1 hypothetical protein [Oceanimonas sp. CHS3-5]